jgi:general secretion pathway protein F
MLFKIKAYRDMDGVVLLNYDAVTQQEAVGKAEAEGYRVITASASMAFSWKMPSPRFPLVLFTQELLSLLEAGLPLLGAIEALAKKEQRPEPAKVYKALSLMLREGKPLSVALESFPAIFPKLYIALVSASERTGDLPQSLKRYLSYRESVDAIRGRISSAAIYPALLMLVGGLVVIFLMTYVVPRFSQVYEDIGGDLPWMSQLLMEWGKFFKANGGTFFLGLAMGIGIAIYWITRPRTRHMLSQWVLSLPMIGERIRLYELSRFYRTLGMLLEGGIHIRKALDMTAGLLGQQNLKAGLQQATQDISEGRSISDAMQRNGLSSEVAYQMLAVGERSGNLGEMMARIARFYDDDMARWMDWFTKLFEPLLMVFIGFIIGGIVLLMYMPIFELAGSIQ